MEEDGGEGGWRAMNQRPSDGSNRTGGVESKWVRESDADDEDMPDIASMLNGSLLMGRGGGHPKVANVEDATDGDAHGRGDAHGNGDAQGTPTTNSFSDICPAPTTGRDQEGERDSPNFDPFQLHGNLDHHNPQQQQYTWIMETGRGGSPTPSGQSPFTLPPFHHCHQQQTAPLHASAYANALYHNLLGANALPLHFQHLLAASSLLWNPYEQNRSGPYPFASSPHAPYGHSYFPFPAPGANSGKKCSNCGATSTPSWRRCPAGKNLLCNACGLYQKLHKRARPFKIADDGSIRVQRAMPTPGTSNGGVNGRVGVGSKGQGEEGKICRNCETKETPLWRKVGRDLCCNACALFYKTHGYHRPVDTGDRVIIDTNGEGKEEIHDLLTEHPNQVNFDVGFGAGKVKDNSEM